MSDGPLVPALEVVWTDMEKAWAAAQRGGLPPLGFYSFDWRMRNSRHDNGRAVRRSPRPLYIYAFWIYPQAHPGGDFSLLKVGKSFKPLERSRSLGADRTPVQLGDEHPGIWRDDRETTEPQIHQFLAAEFGAPVIGAEVFLVPRESKPLACAILRDFYAGNWSPDAEPIA